MRKIIVNLNYASYPIYIDFNLLNIKDIFYPLKKNDRVMLVTDTVLSPIWKNIVLGSLVDYGMIVDELIIPDGEKYKNFVSVELLISNLLNKCHDRHTTLIALGGGVIGDLTGFVASIYQRGIRFIQIPTTLLSQVDAAIGGKTGVNHVLGKNMIGSFWQPTSVIINLNFLNTLPKNQFISGLSEVVKYAIAFDYDFFVWLEKNINDILSLNMNTLLYCVTRCCELKKKIIVIDERENNCRMLLNLGHTYGHAIESYFEYSSFLHGESVSIGIVIALYTSEILGLLNIVDIKRIINLLEKIGLPTIIPKEISSRSFLKYMIRDKKNYFGQITLILPTSIGEVKVFNNVSKNIIMDAIQMCY
ncbi:3-dehydroquinate synthase [Buchnera aphidicola]|uniref:3-dehydroquinate synthase n=1 Tax=Buchnera aphidicola (Stegophylla sp.) TaxID=2315800 RepID=A0A4D6Y938_9GAMM|nr:3-dehydroquinate synthase [Buchnera aphidicola (Stegophylla sp.)]QCI26496.1 3-dehydroquinate synthase [Buchnera aphidicola (Stegophylla sp.)]